MEILSLDTIASLIPNILLTIAVSVLFCLLRRKSVFQKLSYPLQQGIIGVIFGLVAIFSTEYGVSLTHATVNVRDAAPLCAGLLFGAPAGIIAGLIGGTERWFASFWGAGMYSRIACTVSTILAGFYAAYLRKTMFDDKRPSIGFSAVIAVIMEIAHLSLLFLTHPADSMQTYQIVRVSTIPMSFCNCAALTLSTLFSAFLDGGKHRTHSKKPGIAQSVQRQMLLSMILAYLFTALFVFILQTNTAYSAADSQLRLNITDIQSEINLLTDSQALTMERHLGETGYILITDAENHLLNNCTAVQDDILIHWLSTLGNDIPQYTLQLSSINGVRSLWMTAVVQSYRIIAVLPTKEAFYSRNLSAYIILYIEILIFALIFGLIYRLLKKLVINNIHSVNEHLRQIIGGNLNVTVDVRSCAEFSSLSDDINSTVTTMKQYIADAAARIDQELTFARSIQISALPPVASLSSAVPEISLSASMIPARDVGGDFYDFYMLDDRHFVFLIADVSGKGIPAAMFMMRAKTMLKNLAEENLSVHDILTQANLRLCEGNDAGMFVTAWMGILDISTGHLTFANAGHNPPFLYRAGEGYQTLYSKPGFVLAGMEGIHYRMQTLDLAPGDRLFLYTDGVTEAIDTNEHPYGSERLLRFINEHSALTQEKLLEAIQLDIETFVSHMDPFDDMTMLSFDFLRYRGEHDHGGTELSCKS